MVDPVAAGRAFIGFSCCKPPSNPYPKTSSKFGGGLAPPTFKDTVEREPVMKEELIALLCEKSFQMRDEAEFTLASGKKSRYYINCKPTVLSPRGMYLAGNLVLETVREKGIRGIGGLTFGADPIAVATAFASELADSPIQAFSIRKTRKDHGMIRWIEGDLVPGDKVVILDDVATTGGSTIKAIERAREEGMEVVGAVVLVDRQEGGLENIARHVDWTASVVTREELVAHLEKNAG